MIDSLSQVQRPATENDEAVGRQSQLISDLLTSLLPCDTSTELGV